MKTLTEFKQAVASSPTPSEELSRELQSLWLERAGDWEAAHELTNEMHGKNGAWIHAYLHRVEGDLWNAEYWYSQAGESLPEQLSLEQEWDHLVTHFLS